MGSPFHAPVGGPALGRGNAAPHLAQPRSPLQATPVEHFGPLAGRHHRWRGAAAARPAGRSVRCGAPPAVPRGPGTLCGSEHRAERAARKPSGPPPQSQLYGPRRLQSRVWLSGRLPDAAAGPGIFASRGRGDRRPTPRQRGLRQPTRVQRKQPDQRVVPGSRR